ncbi:hypothetical protein HF325_006324 [Metschnikowia pulcherrima]|uniref:Uncharacterized protein n=1 Tax=Metschnikowia pulcherrima TaxID=27326 RepID=A0A8H7GQ29_9ASCO|nr:hypothetical protein HF325_006324 [Metschnikowia pulcherrima]
MPLHAESLEGLGLVTRKHVDKSALQLADVRERHDKQHISQTEIQPPLVQDWIELFIHRLKTFVISFKFQRTEFNKNLLELTSELSALEVEISQMRGPNGPLKSRLRFARYLFNVMQNASHILQRYNLPAMEQSLVRKVVHLNVALLTIPGFHGFLEPQHLRRATLQKFTNLLLYWEEAFLSLLDVSTAARQIFEAHAAVAKHALEVMMCHLSIVEVDDVFRIR